MHELCLSLVCDWFLSRIRVASLCTSYVYHRFVTGLCPEYASDDRISLMLQLVYARSSRVTEICLMFFLVFARSSCDTDFCLVLPLV